MGPYKCPDCGIWWAGFEHRCRFEVDVSTGRSPSREPEVRNEEGPLSLDRRAGCLHWTYSGGLT